MTYRCKHCDKLLIPILEEEHEIANKYGLCKDCYMDNWFGSCFVSLLIVVAIYFGGVKVVSVSKEFFKQTRIKEKINYEE